MRGTVYDTVSFIDNSIELTKLGYKSHVSGSKECCQNDCKNQCAQQKKNYQVSSCRP